MISFDWKLIKKGRILEENPYFLVNAGSHKNGTWNAHICTGYKGYWWMNWAEKEEMLPTY